MFDEIEIGQKIKELREERGLSQSELGKELDRTHAAISDIERGKTRLTVRDLRIIADFFSVSISEMLGEKPKSLSFNRDVKDITKEGYEVANEALVEAFHILKQRAKNKNK